jgi:hypothetical protein
MKHPIYLALAATACAYLVLADARGWNPFYTLIPFRTGPGGASVHHK